MYLRPVEFYVTAEEAVSFATLIEAASRRGETAIGYPTASDHGGDAFAIHVNPFKARVFGAGAGDRVIVLGRSVNTAGKGGLRRATSASARAFCVDAP